MKLTAQEIYNRLVNVDKIFTIEGQITFDFGNIPVTVKQKDVVGNILQEWMQAWLIRNHIEFAPNDNPQMPPDFYLDRDDRTKNLLEIKAFNRNATPGFDIADFKMYSKEIIVKPYMLDVDYLIFGYDMRDDGIVTVKNLWLKKVWQITRRMENWPLNLQVKNDVVHKIRPGVWYSTRNQKFPIFRRLEDFVSAIEQTVYQNPDTRGSSALWEVNFLRSYRDFYGHEIEIPRWQDIANSYVVSR